MIFNSTGREGVLVMLLLITGLIVIPRFVRSGETCILFVAGSNRMSKGFYLSSRVSTSGNFSSLGIEYGGQQCVGQNPGNRSLLMQK